MKQMNLGALCPRDSSFTPGPGSHKPIKTPGMDVHDHSTVICTKGTWKFKEGVCYAIVTYPKSGENIVLTRDGQSFTINQDMLFTYFEVCSGLRTKDTVFKGAWVHAFRDGDGYKENSTFRVESVGSTCRLRNQETGESVSVKMDGLLKDFV